MKAKIEKKNKKIPIKLIKSSKKTSGIKKKTKKAAKKVTKKVTKKVAKKNTIKAVTTTKVIQAANVKTTKNTTKTKTKSVKKGMIFNYAPAPESTKVEIQSKYNLYIGGEFVSPRTKKYIPCVNPANQKEISQIAVAGKEDVNIAVENARSAYENTWSKLTGTERAKYLFRIARIIQERSRELAVLETLDSGKPIKESRDVDMPLVAQHFFYYAGWADKLDYLIPGQEVESIGVCAQIIPWNFPLMMAAWKIAPALAAGNTVVLKPAEQTSLTALRLAEIFSEAKLPPGVVNIITGEGETGAHLAEHHDVNKIAFTGSTDIGKLILRNVSNTGKKLTMELGGKSAHLIFADAAIDSAIEGVINGIFFNQGHVCCAGSRLLVEESIKDVVIKKLKRRINQIRIGDPLDKNTDLGAINSKEQLEKIKMLVELGKKEGGEFWEREGSVPKTGNFFNPIIFWDQSGSCTLSKTEVFGPVLSIMTFRTTEEAIQKANDTNYGLAAGIWSEKGSKIHHVAAKLKAGVIWANTYNKFDAASPFGGFKESGFGREGGRMGMFPYVEVK
ncbi:aldehyde dehydrogenase family protein [Bacteriovoracaceae bacterium]|nr:aldehyde dehydrogenase family protein [Bacteriovoracaceae bacterium]